MHERSMQSEITPINPELGLKVPSEIVETSTGLLTEPASQTAKDVIATNDIIPTFSIEVAKGMEIHSESISPFSIEKVLPLNQDSFPDLSSKGKPLSTIANVNHLLKSYGITVRYDTIRKKLMIVVSGYSGTPDNADNVAISHIISLASLNRISAGQIPTYVAVIADKNQYNPVADWITSKNWDGVDRLQDICDTLVHREDFPAVLKRILLHRWLISAVAAALQPSGFRARGVLTLQGPQSIGKTTWISSFVPDPILRENTVKLDHHLDASNKDSLITAVTHWIVEIGELDSSFRKDIARLKGFLTSDRDKVRRPYGRSDSEYQRRTVFTATVNDSNFLVDSTGNSRWWTIPVTKINYAHGIDMQQLFAQMAVDFHAGVPWWLAPEEEDLLEAQNKEHRSISVIRERVLGAIDLNRVNESNLLAMSPTDLLIRAGITNPTNSQCKECANILRENLGEPKKIKGSYKWRVPLVNPDYSASQNTNARFTPSQPTPSRDDDDLY